MPKKKSHSEFMAGLQRARLRLRRWKTMHKVDEGGYVTITRLHREDLREAFENITDEELALVSDAQLERIARNMADDYCNQLYWCSLSIIAADVLDRDDGKY